MCFDPLTKLALHYLLFSLMFNETLIPKRGKKFEERTTCTHLAVGKLLIRDVVRTIPNYFVTMTETGTVRFYDIIFDTTWFDGT